MLSDSEFIQLVEQGDYDEVHAVLQGAPWLAIARDEDGRTSVECAAMCGDGDMAKLLLDNGADAGRCGPAMLRAATEGWLGVVQALFYGGVRLDVRGDDGCTPLHEAAAGGHDELVRWLLYAGADRDLRDDERRTPLGLARQSLSGAELERIKEAFAEHAGVVAEAKAETMTLDEAIRRRDIDVVDALLADGADPNGVGPDGKPPLVVAIQDGTVATVGLLLDCEAEPNSTYAGEAILCHAVRAGKLGAVEALIKAGADPNARGSEQREEVSVSCVALMARDLRILQTLRKHGADIEGRRTDIWQDGRNLFTEVAALGDIQAARELLRLGFDANGRYPAGTPLPEKATIMTPLLCALVAGQAGMARFLIENGADVSVEFEKIEWTDRQNQPDYLRTILTPLAEARSLGRIDLMELMLDRGASPNCVLIRYRPNGDIAATYGVDRWDSFHDGWYERMEEVAWEIAQAEFNFGAYDDEEEREAMFQAHVDSVMSWWNVDDYPCEFYLTLLHLCVETGDIEAAELLLQHGADPNDPMEPDQAIFPRSALRTPLWTAVEKQEHQLLRLLLEHGADPDVTTCPGQTIVYDNRGPLPLAVDIGDPVSLALLLENGARVEGTVTNPLHRAAFSDDPSLAMLWLSCGISANAADEYGSSPLHVASQYGSIDVIRTLMEAGADPLGVDNSADTPIEKAARSGRADVLEFLLGHLEDKSTRQSLLNRALHDAIHSSEHAAVRLLLDHGASPDAAGDNGETPLEQAVKLCEAQTVSLLLDRGATPIVFAESGYEPTVLGLAHTRADAGGIIEALLRHGVSLAAVDRAGNTVLHRVVSKERHEGNEVDQRVAALLQHLSDVDVTNNQGETPLHLAADHCPASVLVALLSAGASIEAADHEGRTPLHRAAGRGWGADAVAALIEAGAAASRQDGRGRTALHFASAAGNLDTVRLLLSAGADPTALDRLGETPLTLAGLHAYAEIAAVLRQAGAVEISLQDAILAGNAAAARKLLVAGSDTDQHNSLGELPLHLAVRLGHRELVELLLNMGAITNTDDASGRTPMHIAAGGHREDLVELLLARGALLTSRDRRANTPLHAAASSGSVGIVRLLLTRGAAVDARNADWRTPGDVAALQGRSDLAELLKP